MIMKNQYIRLLVILLGFLMLFQASAYSQEQTTVVVQDESGNPVIGAAIYVGEGSKAVFTNERGEFQIPVGRNLSVLIEASGYETQLLQSFGMSPVVSLIMMPYQLSEKDNVHIPFGVFKKRQIAGSVNVLDAGEILRYDETKSVGGIINGRSTGMFGSSDIRGYGTPLYIINGVPRQSLDINPHEIDQITVVKDLSTAMLYGGQAQNGVVLITTRRGSALKKELNFTLENGFNMPIAYPKYLGAADYMELFNEALGNDGLDPRYSQVQIDSTRGGLNPVRFPDEGYYNSTFLRDWTSYRNFIAEVIRGNENGKFMLNLGWNHSNGWLKVGEGTNERNDRLNMRSGIDFRINDKIELVFDASFILNFSKSPRYSGGDFWNYSSTMLPNAFPTLIPGSLIGDEGMLGAAKLINGRYVPGGTTEYLSNIYGDLIFNGSRNTYERLIEMNTGLDFDLSGITRGLKAKTFIMFDMYNDFFEYQQNTYAVYRPNYTGEVLSSFSKLGTDIKVDDRTVGDATYYRKFGSYGLLDYNRTFGEHQVTAQGLAYLDEYNVEGTRQPLKHGHLGLRANYMFRNKYIAELTGVHAVSTKLSGTNNRTSFSPGIGLGWVLTEEDFLSNISFVNYLKVKANWAMLNTDENLSNYNLGRNYYASSGTYRFNDGASSNTGKVLFPGNQFIGWEKVSNLNAGFEAVLLDYKLKVEGSYFYRKNYDLITRRTNLLPGFFGNLPFENYGSDQVQGIEIGLNHITRIGDFEMQAGSNFVYSVPKLLTADEVYYPDEYRRSVGKATDARFGYVAEGLFKDQADIDNHAFQSFGAVQPGDIKYKDLNGDEIIDENDQKMIGNSRSRYAYSFNLRLKYKAFELFALGTGRLGSSTYFNNAYYWVYGNRKYSELVSDRWTPETAETATYPRLSSSSNTNNFRNSTFWLYENNWFVLHTVQLTYTLKNPGFIDLKEVRFFVRGSNLGKISSIKDKTNLNVGGAPQTRGASLGLNLMF